MSAFDVSLLFRFPNYGGYDVYLLFRFPNYGSYAFNEAYFSENGGLACPPSLIAILALSVLALIRM